MVSASTRENTFRNLYMHGAGSSKTCNVVLHSFDSFFSSDFHWPCFGWQADVSCDVSENENFTNLWSFFWVGIFMPVLLAANFACSSKLVCSF